MARLKRSEPVQGSLEIESTSDVISTTVEKPVKKNQRKKSLTLVEPTATQVEEKPKRTRRKKVEASDPVQSEMNIEVASDKPPVVADNPIELVINNEAPTQDLTIKEPRFSELGKACSNELDNFLSKFDLKVASCSTQYTQRGKDLNIVLRITGKHGASATEVPVPILGVDQKLKPAYNAKLFTPPENSDFYPYPKHVKDLEIDLRYFTEEEDDVYGQILALYQYNGEDRSYCLCSGVEKKYTSKSGKARYQRYLDEGIKLMFPQKSIRNGSMVFAFNEDEGEFAYHGTMHSSRIKETELGGKTICEESIKVDFIEFDSAIYPVENILVRYEVK